ncbi:hypothetical protein JCM10450v2_008253 [Rhodotorula kratochvilovae]
MPDETPRAAPHANINDLPAELKIKIARLCAEHDEHLRSWTKPVASQTYGPAKDGINEMWRTYGHSIGALFCTSKDWSEIAAPFRFQARLLPLTSLFPSLTTLPQVLKASRTSMETFRNCIAPSYLSHFTKVVFDKAPSSTYETFFPLLSRLTNVTTLNIHDSPIDVLEVGAPVDWATFVHTRPVREPLQAALAVFKDTIAQVTRLEAEFEGYALLLVDLLASAPELEEFEVHGDIQDFSIPDVLPSTLPPLRSLALEVYELRPCIFHLAALFRNTLTRLVLGLETTPDEDAGWADYVADPASFPQVKELELEGSNWALADGIAAITPETFPDVRRIVYKWEELSIYGRTEPSNDCYIHARSFLDAKDHPLEEVRLMDPTDPLYPSECRAIAAWDLPPGKRVALHPSDTDPSPALLIDWRTGGWAEHAWDGGDGEEAVDRAIDYLVEWRQRARAAGPAAQAAEYRRMAAALRTVELDRVAMQG